MPATKTQTLTISSSEFENEGNIPSKYTCEGDGINPPLAIAKMPETTKSLAIIAEDPDATKGTFDHWLVWNIPPAESIKENSNAGTAGKNSSGKTGYYPPCPPSGSHRYYFHVYAVDVEIDLKAGADKPSLKKAIEAHIIAEGTIMGRYKKANG